MMAMPPESAVPSDVPLLHQCFVTAVLQSHAELSEFVPMTRRADNWDAFILPGTEDFLPFPSGRYSMLVKLLEVSRHDHTVARLLKHHSKVVAPAFDFDFDFLPSVLRFTNRTPGVLNVKLLMGSRWS